MIFRKVTRDFVNKCIVLCGHTIEEGIRLARDSDKCFGSLHIGKSQVCGIDSSRFFTKFQKLVVNYGPILSERRSFISGKQCLFNKAADFIVIHYFHLLSIWIISFWYYKRKEENKEAGMKSRNKKILAEIARNFSEGELIVKIEYEGNSQARKGAGG